MSGYLGDLDSSSGEWDEDGFHLHLDAAGDAVSVRVRSVETARELLASVEGLRGWIAEHDRERAAYDAASPAERARVLGLPDPDDED